MGSYCYLINREKLIRAEAYKFSGGGEFSGTIEEEKDLVLFLEYCKQQNLQIECVHESFFDLELVEDRVYRHIQSSEV